MSDVSRDVKQADGSVDATDTEQDATKAEAEVDAAPGAGTDTEEPDEPEHDTAEQDAEPDKAETDAAATLEDGLLVAPGEQSADADDKTAADNPDDDPAAYGEEDEIVADGVASDGAELPLPAAGDGGGDDGGDGGDDDSDGDDASEDGDDEDEDALQEMTLLDHMEELRQRMTKCVIGAIVGFLACYAFSQQMFDMLVQPLVHVLPEGSSLIFTALPEAFFTYLKVSFVAGIFVTSPYSFYQIWAFIAPGLYAEERKWMVPLAAISAIFFVSGALFGYFVVFPFAFQFFMDFGTELIKPMPSLKEYLGFALKLLFAFGLTFELPLFIFFLARLGLVDAPMLRRIRKFAILCAFIFSAILTPPDVVSQVLMAGPIIVLYEGSIFVAQIFGKKRKTREAENEDDNENGEEPENE